MSADVLVTIAHVRAAGLCVHGTRTWFARQGLDSVSYTHLTLPTTSIECRSRWSPYH